jgi:hypothetical protein
VVVWGGVTMAVAVGLEGHRVRRHDGTTHLRSVHAVEPRNFTDGIRSVLALAHLVFSDSNNSLSPSAGVGRPPSL